MVAVAAFGSPLLVSGLANVTFAWRVDPRRAPKLCTRGSPTQFIRNWWFADAASITRCTVGTSKRFFCKASCRANPLCHKVGCICRWSNDHPFETTASQGAHVGFCALTVVEMRDVGSHVRECCG